MQSKFLFAAIATLFATGAAFAQSASTAASAPSPDRAAKMQQRFDRHFTKLDKNGDGVISREEASSSKWLARQFDDIDANKDGNLSKEEMQAYRTTMRDKHKEKFVAQFKAADKDGDGALTKEEAEAGKMPRIVKHFDQIDANKDGKVTPDELRAFMMSKRKLQ